MTTANVVVGKRRVVDGDDELSDAEIAGIYHAGYQRYLRVASAITADRGLGRDAVQDAFAAIVANRRRFDRAQSLEGWVWTAVVNAARSHRRAGWRRRRHEVEAGGDQALPAVEPGGEEVRALVGTLPERQRQVLFLRYFADLDYATIAETLGIATGTVSATLSQAHAALRPLLTGRVDD